MRLIDADAMRIDFDKYVEHIRLIKKGRKQKTEIAILLDCKGAIDNAPTVDAEPVIRCKDCKYYDSHHEVCCVYVSFRLAKDADDYCSDAERGEE